MDSGKFDDLSRRLAGKGSRRSLIKAALGLFAGGALASQADDADALACRGGGDLCSRSNQCCSGICEPPTAPPTVRNRCRCGVGTTICRNTCVNLRNDIDNCGACGHVCPKVSNNQCLGAPICTNGACGFEPLPSGTWCNDGNACTQTDACDGHGTCVGTNPIACTALDQCHVAGTCNPQTGQCSNPIKANGSACNDGNACTQTDTCQNGVCTGSNPVVCTALDQCHNPGTCNPQTGQCTNPEKPYGSPCNDGNACTQTDICISGACYGTNPVQCTAQDQCHTAGTCDPQTGQCSNPKKPDGTACNDGNLCTQTDTCQNGECIGGNPVVCTAKDQCHSVGVCYPPTGVCSNPQLYDGAPCNDGNACTVGDYCAQGQCLSGQTVTCPAATNDCFTAGTCNPASGCSDEVYRGDGAECAGGVCCDETCMSSFSTAQNCGSCGHVCPSNYPICWTNTAGTQFCGFGGYCFDCDSDSDCISGYRCVGGQPTRPGCPYTTFCSVAES